MSGISESYSENLRNIWVTCNDIVWEESNETLPSYLDRFPVIAADKAITKQDVLRALRERYGHVCSRVRYKVLTDEESGISDLSLLLRGIF